MAWTSPSWYRTSPHGKKALATELIGGVVVLKGQLAISRGCAHDLDEVVLHVAEVGEQEEGTTLRIEILVLEGVEPLSGLVGLLLLFEL